MFDDRGVFTMDTKRFAAGISVPTEKALIRAWRDAALGTPAAGMRVKKAPEPCGCGGGGGGGGGGEGGAGCRCGVKKAAEFILKGHDAATTVVVVLHEDYPRELPVYGGEESADALACQVGNSASFFRRDFRDFEEARRTVLQPGAGRDPLWAGHAVQMPRLSPEPNRSFFLS